MNVWIRWRQYSIAGIVFNSILKNLKSSYGLHRRPTESWNHHNLRLHRKTSLCRLTALPNGCYNLKLGGWVWNFWRCLYYRLFQQKNFKFLKFEFNLHYCNVTLQNCLRGHLSGTYPLLCFILKEEEEFFIQDGEIMVSPSKTVHGVNWKK